MFLKRVLPFVLLLALAGGILQACSSSNQQIKGNASSGLSSRVESEAETFPDVKPAMDRLREGKCREALAILRVYVDAEEHGELTHYLLGISYLCTGHYLKGAHHLRMSYERNGSLEPDVLDAAQRSFEAILDDQVGKTTTTNTARALYLLASMGAPSWYRPQAGQALGNYAQTLLSRGEYSQAQKVVEVMERIGAPATLRFLPELQVLLKLGYLDKLTAVVQKAIPTLGDETAGLLWSAGEMAEKSFRHAQAMWLFGLAINHGYAEEGAHLRWTQAALKAERFDEAKSCYQGYLDTQDPKEKLTRTLAVADLLQRYDRDNEAQLLLEDAIKGIPGQFSVYKALIALDKKLNVPGKRIHELLWTYLSQAEFSREAVDNVGSLVVEWKLAESGQELFRELRAKGKSTDLIAFFEGALHKRQGEDRKASRSFKEAMNGGTFPETPLRIARFLDGDGHREDAIQFLKGSINSSPDSTPLVLDLGDLLESKEKGQGLTSVRKWLKRHSLPAPRLLQAAKWFETRQEPEEALQLAKQASKGADNAAIRFSANLMVARLLLASGNPEEALIAYSNALNEAPDPTGALLETAKEAKQSSNRGLACLVTGRMESLPSPKETLVEPGAILSLRCGKPLAKLLERYVSSSKDKAAALEHLAREVWNPVGARVLGDIWASSKSTPLPGKLLASLAELLSRFGEHEQAAQCAAAYVKQTSDKALAMSDLAHLLSLHGSNQAALTIAAAAWNRSDNEQKELVGPTYISLLLMNGEQEDATAKAQQLIETAGNGGRLGLVLGGLLLDAGAPETAEAILLRGLEDPTDGDWNPRALGNTLETPDDKDQLGSLQLDSFLNTQSNGSREALGRMLLGLLVHSWSLQEKPWNSFATIVAPKVKGWHGEHLVAEALQRIGQVKLAAGLYAEAFNKSPGDLRLFKALTNIRLLEAFQNGQELQTLSPSLDKLAHRFVAARENDPDALRQCAEFLSGRGFFQLASTYYLQAGERGRMDVELAMALGSNLLSTGDSTRAIQFFETASKLSGCNEKTLKVAQEELERVGKGPQTRTLVKACLTRYPKDPRLILLKAELYQPDLNDEQLTSLLSRALEKQPDLLSTIAEKLVEWNRMKMARTFVDEMLKSSDPAVALHGVKLGFQIAQANREIGYMVKIANRFLANHGRTGTLLSEVSSLFFKLNLEKEGIALLREAAKDGNEFANLLLGTRELARGNDNSGIQRVLEYFEKQVQTVTPEMGQFPEKDYMALAVQLDLLADSGHNETAEKLLALALKRFPNDVRLRTRHQQVLLSLGRGTEVVTQWAGVCSTYPDPGTMQLQQELVARLRADALLVPAVRNLMRRYEDSGEPGCLPVLFFSLTSLKRDGELGLVARDALRKPGLSPVRLMELAVILLSRGSLELAEVYLLEALSQSQGRESIVTMVHRQLCQLYKVAGTPSKITHLNQLLLLRMPTNLELRQKLGENLVETEYLDEAAQQFRRLALFAPNHLKAQFYRFQIALITGKKELARQISLETAVTARTVINGLLTMASLARRKLQFDLAYELYQDALNLDKTNQPLRFAVAELALVTGNQKDAWKLFKEFVEGSKGEPGVVAQAVQNMARYDELGMAQALLKSYPDKAGMTILGHRYLKAGMPEEAVTWLKAGLDTRTPARTDLPDSRDILNDLAGRPQLIPDDLLSYLTAKGCAGGNNPPGCQYFNGVALLRAGKVAKALEQFRSELQGNANTQFYVLAAFRTLCRWGHTDEALTFLERSMAGYRSDQVNREALRTLNELIGEENPSKKVVQKLVRLVQTLTERLLRSNPENFWHITQQAEIEVTAGRSEEALQIYEKALRISPWEGGLYNNLAYLLANLDRDIDRGLRLVEQALLHEPAHGAFYLDTWGWLLYRKGELARAAEKVAGALARSSLDFGASLAEGLYHLATIQLKAGLRDDAIRRYRLASVLDPFGRYGRLAREQLKSNGEDPYNLEFSAP